MKDLDDVILAHADSMAAEIRSLRRELAESEADLSVACEVAKERGELAAELRQQQRDILNEVADLRARLKDAAG